MRNPSSGREEDKIAKWRTRIVLDFARKTANAQEHCKNNNITKKELFCWVKRFKDFEALLDSNPATEKILSRMTKTRWFKLFSSAGKEKIIRMIKQAVRETLKKNVKQNGIWRLKSITTVQLPLWWGQVE